MMNQNLKLTLLGLLTVTLTAAPLRLQAQGNATSTAAPDTNIVTTAPVTTTAPTTTTPGLEATPSTTTTMSETNAPAKKVAKKKAAPSAPSSHGKLESIDQVAKTITIGKKTYQVTSKTMIYTNGVFALMQDGTVGDETSVTYKKDADGTLSALTVHYGAKSATEAKPKKAKTKSKSKDDSGSNTNEVGTAM